MYSIIYLGNMTFRMNANTGDTWFLDCDDNGNIKWIKVGG